MRLTLRSIPLTVVPILLAVLQVGCIPAGGVFYAVSAPEGTTVGDQCGGSSGPHDILEIIRNGVRITVGLATGVSRSGSFVVIELRVPSTSRVDFPLSQIQLSEVKLDTPIATGAPILYVFRDGGFKELQSDRMLEGSAFIDPIYNASVFRVELKFDNPVPDEINLVLPAMSINGNSYLSLKINYKKTRGTWISLVNC
jgi:hypothetical protein